MDWFRSDLRPASAALVYKLEMRLYIFIDNQIRYMFTQMVKLILALRSKIKQSRK